MDAAQVRPPIPNGIALPTNITARDYSPQESILWLEQFAKALDHTARLAVDVTSTKAPDGTLTLVITPQNR